jgi:hypothetical protein
VVTCDLSGSLTISLATNARSWLSLSPIQRDRRNAVSVFIAVGIQTRQFDAARGVLDPSSKGDGQADYVST